MGGGSSSPTDPFPTGYLTAFAPAAAAHRRRQPGGRAFLFALLRRRLCIASGFASGAQALREVPPAYAPLPARAQPGRPQRNATRRGTLVGNGLMRDGNERCTARTDVRRRIAKVLKILAAVGAPDAAIEGDNQRPVLEQFGRENHHIVGIGQHERRSWLADP